MYIELDIFTIFLSMVSLGLVLINLSGLRRKSEKSVELQKNYNPKALVILPCKGVDVTLDSNIKSLKMQDYQNFMLIAVVDDDKDEAIKALNENMVDYIFAKDVCSTCSGKVRAIATAYETYPDYDIYVIADSDVEAREDWLSKLVGKLADPSVGISTTFPLFKPKAGFWPKVKMVWGFVGDGMMESSLTRFGWGGSLAFRKDLLEGEAYESFKKSLSDDIAITRASRKRGLKVGYVPERIAVVNSDDNFGKFWEWSNRQTALSITGSRRVFQFGVIIYLLDIILLLSSITLSILVSYLYLFLLVPFVIGAIKTYKRAGSNWSVDLWLIYLFINFLYLANLITASRMKSITWRGNQYELKD
ncbi:MAG: glycosyltransferase family 2 protein [Candidatus Micrarchaeaceae archaeon]